MPRVDQRFDEIMMNDLKSKIMEAFLDLESRLCVNEHEIRQLGETELSADGKRQVQQ